MKKIFILLTLCLSFIIVPMTGYADKIKTNGDPVQFKGKMTESIASQLNAASDLTTSAQNRAVLAAFLSLEFQMLIQNDTTSNISLDLSTPIYVGKSGNMASVSFNTNKGYVLIIFQTKPLSTYYAFSGSTDSKMAKQALDMSSDQVWEVDLDDYVSAAQALLGAIQ